MASSTRLGSGRSERVVPSLELYSRINLQQALRRVVILDHVGNRHQCDTTLGLLQCGDEFGILQQSLP